MHFLEKAAWMGLIAAMLGAEIHSIRSDRATNDREQREVRDSENQKFESIADGLKSSIQISQKHFDATMHSMQGLLGETTGGNSYLYFDIGDVMGPLGISTPNVQKGEMLTNGFPTLVGNYPLHNVYVQVYGPRGWESPGLDYGSIFPHELGRPRQGIEFHFQPDRPRQHFMLLINTSNGSYAQDVLFVKIGDKWVWASRFSKMGIKKMIRVWNTPGFPKEEFKSNWFR